MDTRLKIYLVNVTIERRSGRKVSNLFFARRVTKGNDFETRLRFLRVKAFCKDFDPKTDRVINIQLIKQVGDTGVIDN
jgi:hypothetical protein